MFEPAPSQYLRHSWGMQSDTARPDASTQRPPDSLHPAIANIREVETIRHNEYDLRMTAPPRNGLGTRVGALAAQAGGSRRRFANGVHVNGQPSKP